MLPLLIIMMYFYLLTSKFPKWSVYIFLQSPIVFNLIAQTWTSVFRMYQDCLLQVHRHLPIDLVKSFFTELHKWWVLLNSTLSILFSSWWCFWPLGFQVIHISRSLFRSPSPKTFLMVGLGQGPWSSVSRLLHFFSSHSILLSRAAIALTLTTLQLCKASPFLHLHHDHLCSYVRNGMCIPEVVLSYILLSIKIAFLSRF